MTLKEFTVEEVAKGLFNAGNAAKSKRMKCERISCPWEELFDEAKDHYRAMAEYTIDLLSSLNE